MLSISLIETVIRIGAVSFSAAGAWTDLRTHRLPNRLAAAGVCFVALVVALAESGAANLAGRALLGAAVSAAPLLVVHLIQPEGLGFGDVKYAAVLGLFVGILGWPLLLAVWTIAAAVAIAGIAIRPGWKQALPLGACLATGLAVAALVGPWSLDRVGWAKGLDGVGISTATISEVRTP